MKKKNMDNTVWQSLCYYSCVNSLYDMTRVTNYKLGKPVKQNGLKKESLESSQDSGNRKQYKAIKVNPKQWIGLKAQSMQVATRMEYLRRLHECTYHGKYQEFQWDKQSEIAGKWSWLKKKESSLVNFWKNNKNNKMHLCHVINHQTNNAVSES